MLRRKSEYAWKFLRENNCDDVTDNITNGMRCTICGKVMINAHIGGCGCVYCLDCMTAYLNGESRFCPGNGDYCQQELMVIDENVLPDHAMNLKISKLIVKCPRDGCQFTNEIRKLEDHEQVCATMTLICPFSDMGCPQIPMAKDEFIKHLCDEMESHETMRKNYFIKVKAENESMTAEFKAHCAQYMANEAATSQLLSVVQEKYLLAQRNLEKLSSLACEFQKQKAEWKRGIDEVGRKLARYDHEKMINVRNSDGGKFGWCVVRWPERTGHRPKEEWPSDDDDETKIWIDTFYLYENGYNTCLRIEQNGSELEVMWYLKRGAYDEHLSWPLRGDVTLSVVNQETGLDHQGLTVKYDQHPDYQTFVRPATHSNRGFF